jgi:hypothetical protein
MLTPSRRRRLGVFGLADTPFDLADCSVMLFAGVCAGLVPAVRASLVAPLKALRQE